MSQIDPVDVAIISARLSSICREMGETMLRTSRSPIFSEARDFTTAIFDHNAELVAQTIYIPDIAASTPFTARAIAERFAGDIHAGDLFVLERPLPWQQPPAGPERHETGIPRRAVALLGAVQGSPCRHGRRRRGRL